MTDVDPSVSHADIENTRPGPIRRVLHALRHPLGGGSGRSAGTSHELPASFADAERAAFRSIMEVPPPTDEAWQSIVRAPVERAPFTLTADPMSRVRADEPAVYEPWPPTFAATDGEPSRAAASAGPPPETAAEEPGTRKRRQPGDGAPGALLRTPTGAESVAQDFFDSLIRRVEGGP